METLASKVSEFPVDVEEVLEFCRAPKSSLKTFETVLLPAAFEMVEEATGRLLARREVRETFNDCPEDGTFYLSFFPICRVLKLEKTDSEGCWGEQDLTDFEANRQSRYPWIRFKCGICLCPSACCPTRYRVTYLAGPLECELPARAKILLFNFVAEMNANRNATTERNLKETPLFKRLIKSLSKPLIV